MFGLKILKVATRLAMLFYKSVINVFTTLFWKKVISGVESLRPVASSISSFNQLCLTSNLYMDIIFGCVFGKLQNQFVILAKSYIFGQWFCSWSRLYCCYIDRYLDYSTCMLCICSTYIKIVLLPDCFIGVLQIIDCSIRA